MILATLSLAASLVARIAAVQGAVKSYTADVRADITMRSFPYLSASPSGEFYHKEPGRNKLVFTSGVPFVAQQFSNTYPNFPSASQWDAKYAIGIEQQGGGSTTLSLVPKDPSRVARIDVKVDDKTADVLSLRFNYDDGGFASMEQRYAVVQGHRLVTGEQGHVQEPNYAADWDAAFSNFKLGAAIPDSVFE